MPSQSSAHSLVKVPGFAFLADVTVLVGSPIEVGPTSRGNRRVIPILGGEAVASDWRARVLSAGADFQLIATPTRAELDARYVLETDGGDRIFVANRAVRTGSAEAIARLARGEVVAPEEIYFRCTPQFETSARALAWLNDRLFIGSGMRTPENVVMRFFEVT